MATLRHHSCEKRNDRFNESSRFSAKDVNLAPELLYSLPQAADSDASSDSQTPRPFIDWHPNTEIADSEEHAVSLHMKLDSRVSAARDPTSIDKSRIASHTFSSVGPIKPVPQPFIGAGEPTISLRGPGRIGAT
jgi:hypothetical protein